MANLIPFRRMLRAHWSPWDDLMQLAGFPWDETLATGVLYPAIDVEETADAYIVKADVPGYHKGDLEVELNGNTVTIRGKTMEAKRTEDDDNIIYQERRAGEFRRAFTMPKDISSDGAEATFHDGVLQIRLPKVEGEGRRLSIN